MNRLPLLRRLARDVSGSTIVEFALLGPLMMAMMLGVLQLGVGMHGYNAMRSASADVARYAAVQYQTENELSNSQIDPTPSRTLDSRAVRPEQQRCRGHSRQCCDPAGDRREGADAYLHIPRSQPAHDDHPA